MEEKFTVLRQCYNKPLELFQIITKNIDEFQIKKKYYIRLKLLIKNKDKKAYNMNYLKFRDNYINNTKIVPSYAEQQIISKEIIDIEKYKYYSYLESTIEFTLYKYFSNKKIKKKSIISLSKNNKIYRNVVTDDDNKFHCPVILEI